MRRQWLVANSVFNKVCRLATSASRRCPIGYPIGHRHGKGFRLPQPNHSSLKPHPRATPKNQKGSLKTRNPVFRLPIYGLSAQC
ncbi:hypothetical protein [Kingella oralis]|uniref:hypothetical protein n=1 Tax=Kingella oralis TaxID=505 RepID=UPI0034E4AA10